MSQGEPGIELDTSLGYLLKAAASALHSALEAVLRPLGMTITHYACLELLAQRPGLSNSELARGAFVTRQSMNVLLQALERQGLVVRPARAPAGRALPAELTARGRRQLTVASGVVRRVEQDMLANLDAREQDQMRRLLTACIAALTEPPASATQLLRNLRPCRVPDHGPDGVSLHTSRVFFANLATFADPPGPDNATELFARLPLQAIIYAWTVGSYLLGTTGEEELVSRAEQHSNGIPVLMSAPAATAGFRTLEAERIALIHAPFFTDDFDQKGVAYFQERRFDVVHVSHLMPPVEVPHPNTGSVASPAEIYEWVRSHVPPSAQAVFIGRNALRAIGVMAALEEDAFGMLKQLGYNILPARGHHSHSPSSSPRYFSTL